MSDCRATHRCADGRSGTCNQGPGHLTRHLCGTCLAFFDQQSGAAAATSSGAPAPSPPGSHPLLPVFRLMQEAASAPPPSGNEPGAGEKALYGIWRARVATPLGWLNVELILKPDKHFSQLSAMNGLLAYDEGEIKILEHFIHFVVTDHEPKKYNGQDMYWLKNFGYFYTFVDRNTIEFVDDVSKERWVARRG